MSSLHHAVDNRVSQMGTASSIQANSGKPLPERVLVGSRLHDVFDDEEIDEDEGDEYEEYSDEEESDDEYLEDDEYGYDEEEEENADEYDEIESDEEEY